VEKPAVAAKVAVWFWKHRVQPNVDNYHDTVDVTKQINPSLNGLSDRKSNFKEYMQVAMK
jgi:predicted chitinase